MKGREPLSVLWMQSGGCGGCSMSLLNADRGDFPRLLESIGVRWLSHPALSLASGGELLELLAELRSGRRRLDALCIEGSMLRGPSGSLIERLDVIEAMVLRETLLRHRCNKTKAAAELGLSRVGLRAKMQRFGLDKP